MLDFATEELKKEFNDPRQVDWRFRIFLLLLGQSFAYKFGKRLVVSCLGRDENSSLIRGVSAHWRKDKLVCAADLRSSNLDVIELTWLANQNEMLRPYMDIILEDERFTTIRPPGGNHIHIELNPPYWTNLIGLI